MAKNRVVKLVDGDPVANVRVVATHRLNKVLEAIRVFGNCYGSNYEWTEEQIAKADRAILDAAEQAITNIKDGVKIAKAGVQL